MLIAPNKVEGLAKEKNLKDIEKPKEDEGSTKGNTQLGKLKGDATAKLQQAQTALQAGLNNLHSRVMPGINGINNFFTKKPATPGLPVPTPPQGALQPGATKGEKSESNRRHASSANSNDNSPEHSKDRKRSLSKSNSNKDDGGEEKEQKSKVGKAEPKHPDKDREEETSDERSTEKKSSKKSSKKTNN